MKILWVDDQASVVQTFSGILAPLGAEIVFETTAEGALERLTNNKFDLLLVDLRMPPGQWGGLWLLESIKSENINVPVLVLSGEGSQRETILAMRLGAADYVEKDKVSEELLPRVKAVLQLATKNQQEEDVGWLINKGESDICEFKSTLRWSLKANNIDYEITFAVLKTIAAFLNTKGGILLVGVSDDGTVVGLEADQFSDNDKYQLFFWDKIRDYFGPDYSQFIDAKILEWQGKKIFKVNCLPSNRPVYIRWKKKGENKDSEYFFVRTGPKTEALTVRQAVEYIKQRFE